MFLVLFLFHVVSPDREEKFFERELLKHSINNTVSPCFPFFACSGISIVIRFNLQVAEVNRHLYINFRKLQMSFRKTKRGQIVLISFLLVFIN